MNTKEKFKINIAAYLVLKKDGQILLLRRFQTGYQDGNYNLVAGHLDGGETAKQCIIREAEEEIGIILNLEDLKVVYVTHRISNQEYIDIYLSTNNWIGDIVNMEPQYCDDIRWFSVNNLPDNFSPDVKFALENIDKGIFYNEYGW